MTLYSKTKNKKALSTVVATVLLILLTVVAVAIVWGFISGVINPIVANKCYTIERNPELITLGNSYTCFNDTSDELQLMINRGDIEVDNVLISILADGNSRSFTLTNENTLIESPSVRYYNGVNVGTPSVPEPVKLPVKNAGLTYHIGGFIGITKIDKVSIGATIEGKACESTNSLTQIDNCNLFTP